MGFNDLFQPTRDLNKWQFMLQIFKDFRYEPTSGKIRIMVGIMKFTRRVKRGELFGKEHYKGLYKDFTITLPSCLFRE